MESVTITLTEEEKDNVLTLVLPDKWADRIAERFDGEDRVLHRIVLYFKKP